MGCITGVLTGFVAVGHRFTRAFRGALVVLGVAVPVCVAASSRLHPGAPPGYEYMVAAYTAHQAGKLAEAKPLYLTALEHGAQPAWAWHNLALIEHELNNEPGCSEARRKLGEYNVAESIDVANELGH
jgi:hypothetical protein